jgi:hypothetical protein
MKRPFALAIDEEAFEFGGQRQTDMIQLLFVRGGIVPQSSCFGVVFHI